MAFWQNYPSVFSPLNATNLNNLANGWTKFSETFIYSSEDPPVYVIRAPGNLLGYITNGTKIKLTQTTERFGIVVQRFYNSTGNYTLLSVYCGTDYAILNATISDIYYSTSKIPAGFPVNPEKWTVSTSFLSSALQSSPVAGTWYNLGSISLTVPIGSWNVSYSCSTYCQKGTAAFSSNFSALSSSASTPSDLDLIHIHIDSDNDVIVTPQNRKNISISVKTPYYLIHRVNYPNTTAISLSSSYTGNIKAICNYL